MENNNFIILTKLTWCRWETSNHQIITFISFHKKNPKSYPQCQKTKLSLCYSSDWFMVSNTLGLGLCINFLKSYVVIRHTHRTIDIYIWVYGRLFVWNETRKFMSAEFFWIILIYRYPSQKCLTQSHSVCACVMLVVDSIQ